MSLRRGHLRLGRLDQRVSPWACVVLLPLALGVGTALGSDRAPVDAEPLPLPSRHPRALWLPARPDPLPPIQAGLSGGFLLGAMSLNLPHGVYGDVSAWLDWRPRRGFWLEAAVRHGGFDASEHGLGLRVDGRVSGGVEGKHGFFGLGLGATNVYPSVSDCAENTTPGGPCLPPAPEAEVLMGLGRRDGPGASLRLSGVVFPTYVDTLDEGANAAEPVLADRRTDVSQGEVEARIRERAGGFWVIRTSVIPRRVITVGLGIAAPESPGHPGVHVGLTLGYYLGEPVHPGGGGPAVGFDFGARFGGAAAVDRPRQKLALEQAFFSQSTANGWRRAGARGGAAGWSVAAFAESLEGRWFTTATAGPAGRTWAIGLGAGWASEPILAADLRLGQPESTRLYAYAAWSLDDLQPAHVRTDLHVRIADRWEAESGAAILDGGLGLRAGAAYGIGYPRPFLWAESFLTLYSGDPGVGLGVRVGR